MLNHQLFTQCVRVVAECWHIKNLGRTNEPPDLSLTELKTSPFDEGAVQVAQSGPIRLVSPYIGVSYLERLISLAGDWRLITDVEAWLGSLSFRARPRAWSFIRENIEKIHHCPSIHAKLILSESLAMFGSANLTQTGILSRTELGVLLDSPEMVTELQSWFSALWTQTTPPVIDEASAFIKWLDEETYQNPARRQKTVLSSEATKIRAKLAALPAQPITAKDAPLELATVAQTILFAEQKHYESLDQAIEAMLNALAIKGFTLGEAVRFIQEGFTTGLVREIYFGILRHTANHFRSVFAEDTINRLVLLKRRFHQSDKEKLLDSLTRHETFLLFVIHELDFYAPKELHESSILANTSIPAIEQDWLITELIESGLLLLIDNPGEIPIYQLAEDFEWTGRFNLFERSHKAWSVKLASGQKRQSITQDDIEVEDYSIKPSILDQDDSSYDPDYTDWISNITHEHKLREKRIQENLDIAFFVVLQNLISNKHLQVDISRSTAKKFAASHKLPEEWFQKIMCGARLKGLQLFNQVVLSRKIMTTATVTLYPLVSLKILKNFPKTRELYQSNNKVGLT